MALSQDTERRVRAKDRGLVGLTRAIAATDRQGLYTACRALDRVLRSEHYWVAGWYKPAHWIAYWDIFGKPESKPHYARGIPETWWLDTEKAAKLGG